MNLIFNIIELTEEDGLIENLTLVFYLFAAVFVLIYPKEIIKAMSKWAIAILMLAMLAREADLHKFLGMSLLKIKFWLSNETAILNKIIAAAILLIVLCAVLILAISSLKTLMIDLRKKENYAISILMFFIVLITSKILDRSVNMIYELTGWMAPNWIVSIQLPQEEFLECLLPILVVIAIIQYKHKMRLSNK